MSHAKNPGFKPGDNWTCCDICGRDVLASEGKMRWDNLWCCPEDWEARQPQDYVRSVIDNQRVSISRPPGDVQFITNKITADDL